MSRARRGAARPAAAQPVVAADLSFRLAVDELLGDRSRSHDEPVGDDGGAEPAGAMAPAEQPATGSVVTSVPVAGMTCRTCEVRIQRHVGRLPGVRRVRASAVRGRVEIESTARIPAAALARAIRAAGYEVGRTPWLERDPAAWATALAGVLLVAVLALVAGASGIGELGAGAGDLASGGLAVALLLGLAAGVSTCMALVGGLVLALAASFQARDGATGTPDGLAGRLRPALVFVLGRVIGYGVLGAALGAVGATVAMPPQVTAVLMIAVAVLMTILGARLTGLSPRMAAWAPTLPAGLGRRLGVSDGGSGAYSDGRAALLGAASFFLPCGFTQAVQVYALSTGSPLLAGALLAVFAIGTAPGLLALAGLPAVVPATLRPTLLRLAGVAVVAFAFVNASAGLRLSGFVLPVVGAEPTATAPAVRLDPDGRQALTTFQEAAGYRPANATIYAGIPTRWTIESLNQRSCAVFLVVPDLRIQVRLEAGANTIDLPALPPGRLAYSCSMGMYGGTITVVEPPPTGGDPAAGG